jgi:hypothetical protein
MKEGGPELERAMRLGTQKWRPRCWELVGLRREYRGYRMMETTVEIERTLDQVSVMALLQLVLLKTNVL